MKNDNIRAVIISGDNVIFIYKDGSYENKSLDNGKIVIEIKKERVWVNLKIIESIFSRENNIRK